MKKLYDVGGQALVEGVMIKSKNFISVAVRKPDGTIKTKVNKYSSVIANSKFLQLPFIRGIVILFEMMGIGIKELIYSANEQEESEEEKESLSPFHVFMTIILSLLFAIVLFKAIPLLMAKLVGAGNTIVFNLIEGLFRITMFILYLYLISLMEDVKVLFRYHGAEHKSIACYEAREKLTIKNVRKYTTLHPRCGTSFVVLTLIISILVFSIIPTNLGYFKLFLLRLPLLFPIAAISYEVLKFSAKYSNSWFFRQMIKPGLLVQKITTSEPTDKQAEVGIYSLKALLKAQEDYDLRTKGMNKHERKVFENNFQSLNFCEDKI